MPYQCSACKLDFTRKCKLDMHKCEKALPSDIDLHICEDCDNVFDDAKALKKHACPQLSGGGDGKSRMKFSSESESESSEDYSDDDVYKPKKRKPGRKHGSDVDSEDSESKSSRRQKRRKLQGSSKNNTSSSKAKQSTSTKTKRKSKNDANSGSSDDSEHNKKDVKTSTGNSRHPKEEKLEQENTTKDSPDVRNSDNDKEAELFPCPDCGARFSREATLKTHIRTHTGDLPFKCDDCGEKFAYHSSMKSHMRIHTDNITHPYACNECAAKFALEENLEAHMKTHENKSNSIQACDKCKTVIAGPGHTCVMDTLDDRPHVCGECGVRYRAESTLIAHLRVHKEQD